MDPSILDSLTKRERDCLRQVRRGLESKEIAVELGISVHRVDELIASARRKLGGVRRRRAAEMLNAHETPHPSGGQPWGHAAHEECRFEGSGAQAPRDGSRDVEAPEERFAFERFPPDAERADHLRNWLHDLDGPRRLLVVVALTVLIALLILVAPLIAERLGWLGSTIYQRD